MRLVVGLDPVLFRNLTLFRPSTDSSSGLAPFLPSFLHRSSHREDALLDAVVSSLEIHRDDPAARAAACRVLAQLSSTGGADGAADSLVAKKLAELREVPFLNI